MALCAGNTEIPSNGENVNAIKDGENISVDEIRGICKGELITIWKKSLYYYINFDANGGTGSMDQQAMQLGSASELPENLFARSGYLFAGWSLEAEGEVLYTDQQEVTDLADAGETLTLYAVWKRATVVLFDTNDSTASGCHMWYRAATAANGWGTAECFANGAAATWNKIDCTDYTKAIVRINGNISSTPSGATVNHTYIAIGFTTDYSKAVKVVDKGTTAHTDDNNQTVIDSTWQEGAAYNTWYDLEIDVSALTGVQTLNVFVGGAYQNGGTLYCSKITMSAD